MGRLIRETEPPKPFIRLGLLRAEDLTTVARRQRTEALREAVFESGFMKSMVLTSGFVACLVLSGQSLRAAPGFSGVHIGGFSGGTSWGHSAGLSGGRSGGILGGHSGSHASGHSPGHSRGRPGGPAAESLARLYEATNRPEQAADWKERAGATQ